MTSKFFTIMLSAAMLGGIGCLVLAQSLVESLASFGKKPIVVGVITAVLAAATAYLATLLIGDAFALFWILALVFLLFGFIHTSYAHKKFIYHTELEKSKVAFGELLFSLAIVIIAVVVFSAVQFYFVNPAFLFYPLLFSALLFLVPFLMNLSFEAAFGIPQPIYRNWEYPEHIIDAPDDNANEKLLVIGLEIPKKLTDIKKTYFRAKTPESILLGDLFYHFINDYNELQSETPVQFLDNEKKPLVWYFRLKTRWFQRSRVLDPTITIRENKVRENSIIVCERFINEP